MSTALTQIMQRALYELDVGFVVPNADISAFAAQTFTAARFFNNTNMAPDALQIKNAGFIRAGAASSADLWRPAGTLVNSTGVVSQVGPAWSDTTVGTEEIEAWYYGVRRDQEVLKSLNRVTIHDYITTYLALSHLSTLDGDMALSTDTNWTDVGTTSTSAKATTAAVTPAAANGISVSKLPPPSLTLPLIFATRRGSSARIPATLTYPVIPRWRMYASIGLIFKCCVHIRATGLGRYPRRAIIVAKGSPLRLAVLCVTSFQRAFCGPSMSSNSIQCVVTPK